MLKRETSEEQVHEVDKLLRDDIIILLAKAMESNKIRSSTIEMLHTILFVGKNIIINKIGED